MDIIEVMKENKLGKWKVNVDHNQAKWGSGGIIIVSRNQPRQGKVASLIDFHWCVDIRLCTDRLRRRRRGFYHFQRNLINARLHD